MRYPRKAIRVLFWVGVCIWRRLGLGLGGGVGWRTLVGAFGFVWVWLGLGVGCGRWTRRLGGA